MRLNIFLLLFYIIAGCSPQSSSELRIMNGVANDERVGATLALTVGDNPLCSASLITPYHALTARHCVAAIQSNLAVHVGPNAGSPQESAKVARVHLLPYLDLAPDSSLQLNGDSWQAFDLALLELESPLRSVAPYRLIDQPYDWGAFLQSFGPGSSSTVLVAGYGSIGADSNGSTPENKLRHHTEMKVQNLQKGVAELHADNTGACSGDSGGTILFKSSEEEALQLGGALSTGNPCQQGNSVYNTYALVYPQLCWLKKVINSHADTQDFGAHYACEADGVNQLLQPRVDCPVLAASTASRTLLDALAGALGTTDCTRISAELMRGHNLKLFGLQVENVDSLNGAFLSNLDLSFNRIRDLSGVTMSVFGEFNLAHNRLKTLDSIAHISLNGSLIVDHNEIETIPTAKLWDLHTLRLFDNQVTSLPDLSASRRLTTIKAGRNRISSMGPLPTSVKELFLQQNQLRDASFVKDLKSLQRLFLYENQLQEFNAADLPSLSWLTLEKNQITHLSLSRLPSLYEVDFSDNPISQLHLEELPTLKVLKADNSNLNAIPDLSHLTNLEQVWLRNNRIESLEVSRLPQSLKHLELGWNQIKDIAPIVTLQNLEILSLHGSRIDSLDPLLQLPRLKFVAVDDQNGRFARVIAKLMERGVQVSMELSYGYPEIDVHYLHQALKKQFPELLQRSLTSEQVVFLVGTTWHGQVIRKRNRYLPEEFAKALLHEVFEPVTADSYRLRDNVGNRVLRYSKSVNNYF